MTDRATSDDTNRVGHWLQDDCDVYAGRGRDGTDLLTASRPGKRGWLGNPHTVEDHGRAGAIERFRRAFEYRIEHDERYREAVRNLQGQTLGCWCQRLDADRPACHAEVIAEWADRLASEEDHELRADGAGTQVHSGTPVGLDRLSIGDRVQVEYQPYDGPAESIEGTVIELRASQAQSRQHQQATVETQDGSQYLIQAGGGIARERDGELAAWASIGWATRVRERGEASV